MGALFRAGGALLPSDEAFAEEIYGEGNAGEAMSISPLDFKPQVISSPGLTGKTTQLNYFAVRQEELVSGSCLAYLEIVIPRRRRRIGEGSLRKILDDELLSDGGDTLGEILEGSRKISATVVGKSKTLLGIINVDGLDDQALRWLLAGLRIVVEDKLVERLGVQIILDGSFSLETLTAGADSEYPMSQVYPREFSEEGQRLFVHDRLVKLNVSVSEEALQHFYRVTDGDKYLTQALCLHLAGFAGFPDDMVEIGEDEMDACVKQYIQEDPRLDSLRKNLVECVVELRDMDLGPNEVRGVFTRIDTEWALLSPRIRALLYRGGAVRRVGDRVAMSRAPLTREVVDRALSRWLQVRELLQDAFSLEGVVGPERPLAREAVDEIEIEAITGELRDLHVGVGQVREATIIEVDAVALGVGSYAGKLELEDEIRVAPGTEVWFFLWSFEPVADSGWKTSKWRTFRSEGVE